MKWCSDPIRTCCRGGASGSEQFLHQLWPQGGARPLNVCSSVSCSASVSNVYWFLHFLFSLWFVVFSAAVISCVSAHNLEYVCINLCTPSNACSLAQLLLPLLTVSLSTFVVRFSLYLSFRLPVGVANSGSHVRGNSCFSL